MKCRFCENTVEISFANLGLSPLSNLYVKPERLHKSEQFYPLQAWVCKACKLVQLEEFEIPENIFNNEYAYFSSYSTSWLAHAEKYADEVICRFGLDNKRQVVEIASNDGYLLQNFSKNNIPVLGVEPSSNTAEVAIQKGIDTWVAFFGVATADKLIKKGYAADLIIANNVLAHVPDINDFVKGLKIALKSEGVITIEFPHLLNLIRYNQFDTIYHEHFSYLSLLTVERIFAQHQLSVFDVQKLATHGGSLRLFAQHIDGKQAIQRGLIAMREEEREGQLDEIETYSGFVSKMEENKRALLRFLIDAKEQGKRVVGYGAPAKGNTLLNYCGIRTDLLEFTVDANPHKQGTWLPGTRIPVFGPDKILECKPEIVLILPWNLKDEIIAAHSYIQKWGGRFAVPIPKVSFVT